MRTILNLKLVALVGLTMMLASSAFARAIHGYVGRWYFPSFYTQAAVDLYRADGTYVRTTQTYYHPMGIFMSRYHFNNVAHGSYFVVVRPYMGGSATSLTFATNWIPWSNTKAPDVWL
jgi:hypothetical protein